MLRFVATLLILSLLLFILIPRPSPMQEESIANMAVADAKEKFPNANVEVLNITKDGDNYVIMLKVVEGPKSKCPRRYHITYIYPERHFVGEKELMNPTCEPCKCPTPPCILLFEEEAIAATSPYGEGIPHKVEKNGTIWVVYWDNGPISISETCQLVGGYEASDSGQ